MEDDNKVCFRPDVSIHGVRASVRARVRVCGRVSLGNDAGLELWAPMADLGVSARPSPDKTHHQASFSPPKP